MDGALRSLATLAGRLKYARRRAGMTQQEAASAASVARNTISAYERGLKAPSETRVAQLASAYGVQAEWLRSGSSADRPPGATPEEHREGAASAATAPQRSYVSEEYDYVECPACGAKGILRRDMIEHAMGPHCSKLHSQAEAEELARKAKADLTNGARAILEMKAWISEWERRVLATDPANEDLLRVNQETLHLMKMQLRRLVEQLERDSK